MAEFIDIHFHHEPGEPASLWFTDDHGQGLDSSTFLDVTLPEDADRAAWVGGESISIRIQHNDIERL